MRASVDLIALLNALEQGSRDGLRPPSSGVRLRPLSKKFACPPSESVLEADEWGASAVRFRPPGKNVWASAVRIRPWGGRRGYVRRPHPSGFMEFDPSAVRIRPLETVRIGQASVFVRSRPHLSALVRFCPPMRSSFHSQYKGIRVARKGSWKNTIIRENRTIKYAIV